MLILLLLVGVTLSVPLPDSPLQSKDGATPLQISKARHISGFSPNNEQYPTSTHLISPIPNTDPADTGEVTGIHVTKEISRVAFHIVEEVSGSKNLIFSNHKSKNVPDINLEPTEIEAPETTPTTLPLIATGTSIDSKRNSNSTKREAGSSTEAITTIKNDVISLNISQYSENSTFYKSIPTPESILVPITPSNSEKERNIKIIIPASEEKTSPLYIDLLLNDQPVLLQEGPPKEVKKEQDGIKGAKFESSPLESKVNIKSSQIKEDKILESTTTKNTFDLELETEEKLVDLILKDENLRNELLLEAKWQVDEDSAASLAESQGINNNKETEGTIKPSNVKPRDTKTEAFFSVSNESKFPYDKSSNLTEKSNLKKLNITGQPETLEITPSNGGKLDNILPAIKRNPAADSNQGLGAGLDNYDQIEDHSPFADVANRDPALPIEDSEESGFIFSPPLVHRKSQAPKTPDEIRTLGYDGAGENSSEEVKLHRSRAIVGHRTKDPVHFNNNSAAEAHDAFIVFKNSSSHTNANADIILPSSEHIVEAKISGSSHLIPSILASESSDSILGDYTPDSLLDPPRQEKVSVPVSHPIEEVMGPGCVAAIVLGVLLCIVAAFGAFAFFVYHRQTDIRPKVLSDRSCANSDSGGYLDDHCRVAYVNSQLDVPKGTPEDLVSLDNDSFLNSLESMTIQNLWTDSIRHTKL